MPAPTVTQSVLASALAASSLACVFPSSLGPNRCGVLLVCGVRALGAPTFTLTDSRSQVWTQILTLTLDAGLRRLSAYVGANLAEGPLTVTVTPSAASDLTAVALEVRDAARVSPVTASTSATGIGTTPSLSLTMPAENHLVLGALTHLGVQLALGVGAGYTLVREEENPAVGPTLLVEAQAVTAPVTVTVEGALALSATWGLVGVLVQSLAVFVPTGATIISGGVGGSQPVPAGMA